MSTQKTIGAITASLCARSTKNQTRSSKRRVSLRKLRTPGTARGLVFFSSRETIIEGGMPLDSFLNLAATAIVVIAQPPWAISWFCLRGSPTLGLAKKCLGHCRQPIGQSLTGRNGKERVRQSLEACLAMQMYVEALVYILKHVPLFECIRKLKQFIVLCLTYISVHIQGTINV